MISRLVSTVLAATLWMSGQTLRKVASLDRPGPKCQRFGYLTTDDDDHYLLSAHLGPGILYVIELRTLKLVKAIPGVPGITGLEYVPVLRKVYTCNWGEEKIGIVDLRSMKVTKRLTTSSKPNGSTYAAPFRKVYISDTLGKVLEHDGPRIFLNLPRSQKVAVIDRTKHSIVATWQTGEARSNFPIALDEPDRWLFVVGRSPARTRTWISHLPANFAYQKKQKPD